MADSTQTPLTQKEEEKEPTTMAIQRGPDGNETPEESKEAANPTSQVPQDEPLPPAKPPRPLSPQAQAEKTLKEAFPSLDAAVVKAVLSASGGAVEPAFDALLGMTDPESQKDIQPQARPARPAPPSDIPTSTAQSQLDTDEQYARQLHEHYSGTNMQQRSNAPAHTQASQRPEQTEGEREYSFLEDDLPMIRDNIRRGFLETQSTVNKWVSSVRKKLDGEDDDDEGFANQATRPAQQLPPRSQQYPTYDRRSSEMARRSADRERYDADPQVLGDDFSTLELRDTEVPPKKPQRPAANPDLFKSGMATGGRRVSFQKGPPEQINDPRSESSRPLQTQVPGGKSSKWQPLSAVEPSPLAENDPFSLGDSDDDKETKLKDSKSGEPGPSPIQATSGPAESKGDGGKIEGGTTPPELGSKT